MKINFNYIFVIALVFIVIVVMLVKSNLSNSEKLRTEENKISQLQKNIELLENENTVLAVKLKNSVMADEKFNKSELAKVNPMIEKSKPSSKELAVAPVLRNEDNIEAHVAAAKTTSYVDSYVDINKPFNGVDPVSDEQQALYTSFKYEIDGYNFNERFDYRGFMSDARFGQLHASLGSKLLDYVDQKIAGIQLLQDSNPNALTQAEQAE
ncbi:hypothetical protein MNBD_GAMMA22-1630 [hydrothermal vent metagenome]|uniref:Uncharacterized protein n=1 Tax=hydrothermal vent metagenome TaxID=652676 RepID=A0A3B0ZMT5_9ZZZZ